MAVMGKLGFLNELLMTEDQAGDNKFTKYEVKDPKINALW